jgi:hypothetical protein
MIVELYDVNDDIETGLWAHRTCPSFTGWVTIDGEPHHDYRSKYKFYFDQEQDVMIFLMRWAANE